ncbi:MULTISPECIES: transporter substrate-binding domain-containing protein [unclassified Parabacteroides]|uniref:transporter substrate-binding domain-containing protein n=1 Tax=unclassified Parabacteroides TaxID=2649774 RepID=UPI0024772263|nr:MULTISPECIES: transporter substrate-binding domain-containing protein [unclassified Parabacteroides]
MKSRKLLTVYLFLLFLAVATMFVIWFGKNYRKPILPRDYAEIEEEGILRIITEYSPSGYYISGDTIEGFQYELSQAIARVSGLEVQTLLETGLPKSFEALNKNTCDIIARNIPVTSETKENYLFTEPIVMNRQVLLQRTAEANNGIAPIRSQLDLANKEIYVPQNSPALLRLQHLEHEIGDSLYIVEDPAYSSEQLAMMVAKGDIDYAVCDLQDATIFQRELPEIDIQTDISFTQLQAWAVRKNSPVLADSLNSWLRKIKEEGSFDKIYKRYYSSQR